MFAADETRVALALDEQGADPERLDITRQVNRHLSFGLGHHLCIGAPLARMEAQEAVLRLVQRFPDLALAAGEPPEYRPNLQLRGLARLPATVSV